MDEHCNATLKTAYRPGTTRNYLCRVNGYLRFCYFYQYPAFPTQEHTLIRFSRYLANGVTSYDTIKGYLSTIKKSHELAGLPFPEKCHLLKHQLLALRKELAHPVKKSAPVTPTSLSEMYAWVDKSSPLELTCYASLVVGFTLFLRKSNLVPEAQEKFNMKEQLTLGDVGKMGQLYVLSITWSKTNQYRNRDLLLPVIPAKSQVVCCEFWIKFLLHQNRGFPGTSPLIAYPKREKLVPVTYDVLGKKFKEWIGKTG